MSMQVPRKVSGSARKLGFMRIKTSAHALSLGLILFFCFSRIEEGFLLLKKIFLSQSYNFDKLLYILCQNKDSASIRLSCKLF